MTKNSSASIISRDGLLYHKSSFQSSIGFRIVIVLTMICCVLLISNTLKFNRYERTIKFTKDLPTEMNSMLFNKFKSLFDLIDSSPKALTVQSFYRHQVLVKNCSINPTSVSIKDEWISVNSYGGSKLSHVQMDYADCSQVDFSYSTLSSMNFSYADLSHTNFHQASISNSVFRSARLINANFTATSLTNVDFTGVDLTGAIIFEEQFNRIFSLFGARLPNGTIGRNRNLIRYGIPSCNDLEATLSAWSVDGRIKITMDPSNHRCIYQAEHGNTTMQQKIDVTSYRDMIQIGPRYLYIELGGITSKAQLSVYATVRFADNSINHRHLSTSSSIDWIIGQNSTMVTSRIPCPEQSTELEINIIFEENNGTVDHIYATIV